MRDKDFRVSLTTELFGYEIVNSGSALLPKFVAEGLCMRSEFSLELVK